MIERLRDGLNELLAVSIRLGEQVMKTALIIIAVISAALAALSGNMLTKAETTNYVTFWAIMLVVNLFNCVTTARTLGKMH